MCQICKTLSVNTASLRTVDPTRTLGIQRAFIRDFSRRFRGLTAAISKSVGVEDMFGFTPEPNILNKSADVVANYAFGTSQAKINAFMRWFNQQVESGFYTAGFLPQVGNAVNPLWADKYVFDAYQQGATRARYEMAKAGYPINTANPGDFDVRFGGPIHMDRLGLLYSRTFAELKGITSSMDTQISRILSNGMANGLGPKQMARQMNAAITGIGKNLGITDILGRHIPARRRAEMLARTEIVSAHHQATIQEYENWAVEGVKVKAEFLSSKDDRVCDRCASMSGTVYSLADIRDLIPVHPNCRCIALPLEVKPAKKSKRKIKIREKTNIPTKKVTFTDAKKS